MLALRPNGDNVPQIGACMLAAQHVLRWSYRQKPEHSEDKPWSSERDAGAKAPYGMLFHAGGRWHADSQTEPMIHCRTTYSLICQLADRWL